ncbi:Crp/Fnr family transcriptional regulator [Algoriphagus hitonicola]|uniref:cAMP-binding domain of CRP or a regulatory subunit of cAMP-dependent protein kinases n=1 Tax=Algoriphagus hitonicola TaxID=435880 RepID=A0A1I2U2D7_9BACT|nr:Crp/Fnr family transcriptional regulator [Algoriphagus hitonicola]SFG71298.1 cAMP-binding domain of CRP or a regulatory subunit of cAMP-dependent protein kinases [Algoriphagus hitonicola]
MNNFRFTHFLTSNAQLDQELTDKILSHCSRKKIKKGSFLLLAGEKIQHSFFVEKGLLKQYSVDKKGKEHILQFAPENWLMADRESEYFDKASSYFIEAVEDSEVFFINKDLIIQLSKTDERFIAFNNLLLHRHIRSLQKRITQLQSASAEERYLDFIQTYPDLTLRVPQTHIASFLGITPESLSRVRKELADRHRGRS